VIGSDDEAEELVHLLGDHPELGYRLTAVVGDPAEWGSRVPTVPFVPAGHDPAAAVAATGATGVVVASSALASTGRDRLIGSLIRHGLHVQISAGLSRLGHQRLRVAPLAHQLAFYVEPPQLSRGQAAVKRMLDLILASVLLAITAPLMALAAVMIKAQDRGPVFYRQVRVGRDGRTFQLMKLRTMVPDAAARAGELAAQNERQGPLFKVTNDPRVTRVGRFLRMSSIDELTQLINVIRGEMSLVGPRPALPSEVAQFDPDLLERSRVMPGITGLWQVEARDNPSFRAYRRLDLFYVDNWSVGLDLYIMVATVRMLAGRVVSAIFGAGERVGKRKAAELTDIAG
jgi:exopolysaccharide biosynthesis polyprenyl glycosylphosphotransferase